MQTHSDYQIDKNKTNKSEYFTVLGGQKVETQESVALLGVTIDYKLFEKNTVNRLLVT